MLTGLDYAVLAIYRVGVAAFGILAGGKQRSTTDYFLGGRNLPWWAVCFSIVATETSTLTVISVPAVAFGGSLTFFQLTLGYLLGRIIVSLLFLPRYYAGNLNTAYAFLGERYGSGMRATAATTFLITRLLADGVRLFATAIPIKVIFDVAGFSLSYVEIIVLIGLVTIVYTFIGGIRAVVWMDVVQMFVYVGGAILSVILLLSGLTEGWWAVAKTAGKTVTFDFGIGEGISAVLTNPYIFVTAVFGGAIFSMASHGTDQLIVQRLLTCRNLKDSQVALVVSGVVVMVQFALFLFVGLLLWAHYGGVTYAELGLTRADEIFPKFIIEGLPPGVSGFILAGILAAAMSTLSSSLNSLASSTMLDLYALIKGRSMDEKKALWTSRVLTLGWGIVFMVFASLFTDEENPVVELGLAIASFTYGGLLGAFLLGLLVRRTDQKDAIVAFIVTISVVVWMIFSVWYSPELGWTINFRPGDDVISAYSLRPIAWPWYTFIGSLVTLCVGSLLALRHR